MEPGTFLCNNSIASLLCDDFTQQIGSYLRPHPQHRLAVGHCGTRRNPTRHGCIPRLSVFLPGLAMRHESRYGGGGDLGNTSAPAMCQLCRGACVGGDGGNLSGPGDLSDSVRPAAERRERLKGNDENPSRWACFLQLFVFLLDWGCWGEVWCAFGLVWSLVLLSARRIVIGAFATRRHSIHGCEVQRAVPDTAIP